MENRNNFKEIIIHPYAFLIYGGLAALLSVIFVSISAYKKADKDNEVNQDYIRKVVDSSVAKTISKIENNSQILDEHTKSIISSSRQASSEIKSIVSDLTILTSEIATAQDNINSLVVTTNELSAINKEISERIVGYQTGGESYVLAHIFNDYQTMNLMSIEIVVCGDYAMRNVRIHISDESVKENARSQFDVKPENSLKILNNSAKFLHMEMEYFPNYAVIQINLDPKHYNDDMKFRILVIAENGRTDQILVNNNFRSKDYYKYRKSEVTRNSEIINTSVDLGCIKNSKS